MKKSLGVAWLCLLLCISANSYGQKVLKGTTKANNAVLPFVNIGLSTHKTGTISAYDGNFSITLSKESLNDTLIFSHVGYNKVYVPLNSITDYSLPLNVSLTELAVALSDVTVKGKKKVKKTKLGASTALTLAGGQGVVQPAYNILELTRLMPLEKEAWLTAVYLHIISVSYYGKEEEVLAGQLMQPVRINFYENEGGTPGKRIIEKVIYSERELTEKGWAKFDMSAEAVVLDKPFFVSVELMPPALTEGGDVKDKTAVIYMMGFTSSGKTTFYRNDGIGKWKSEKIGIPMYVEVIY